MLDLAFLTLLLTQPVIWLLVLAAALLQSPVTLLAALLSRRRARSYSGRHVLITGGSEGIGLEIAKQCAARGAVVTLVARTRSKLDAARATVLAAMPDAKVGIQTADVSQPALVAEAVKQSEKALGPIDVCIASAGVAIPKYLEDLSHDEFAKMMAVNYFGVVHLAKAVLPGMAARGDGQFAAVCSMAAAVPFVGYAAYAPAKAACRSFVDVLRNEYADTPLQFHVAFPPDTQTPGYERENATKPWETSHVWPEVFNETFQAKDVGAMILDGMAKGEYFLRSPDFFGNLLVERAWGHFPRAQPLLSASIAPLFVGLHGAMVWMADRAVKKGAHHKPR